MLPQCTCPSVAQQPRKCLKYIQELRRQIGNTKDFESAVRVKRSSQMYAAASTPVAQAALPPVSAEAANGITSQEYPPLGQMVARQNARHGGLQNGSHAQQEPVPSQAAAAMVCALLKYACILYTPGLVFSMKCAPASSCPLLHVLHSKPYICVSISFASTHSYSQDWPNCQSCGVLADLTYDLTACLYQPERHCIKTGSQLQLVLLLTRPHCAGNA